MTIGENWSAIVQSKILWGKISGFSIDKWFTPADLIQWLLFFTSAALYVTRKETFTAKYGMKALAAVEDFIHSFGETIIDSVKTAAPIINSMLYKNILTIMVALTSTIVLSAPYRLFVPVTKITPNDAYNLAKKGIDDLISNVLEPATNKIFNLRDSINNFFVTVDSVFANMKKWQGNLGFYISTGVDTALGNLGLAKIGRAHV